MIRHCPLKRSMKPIPRKRAKPRRGPLRDPGYLAFLREEGKCQCCLVFIREAGYCGLTPGSEVALRPAMIAGLCDPAHGPVNGRGSKGPDNGALPLCRVHHKEQHLIGWPAFEAKYGFNREGEAAAWYKAYQVWKEYTKCE